MPVLSSVVARRHCFLRTGAGGRGGGGRAGGSRQPLPALPHRRPIGGNQQKALIGRVIMTGARTLLPVRSDARRRCGDEAVDLEAIRRFAEGGGSVLFYSSELPEIVSFAHRCLVLYGGRVAAEFSARRSRSRRSWARSSRGQAPAGRSGHEPVGNDRADASVKARPDLGGRARPGERRRVVALLYLLLYGLYAFFEPAALSVYSMTSLVNNFAPLAIAAAARRWSSCRGASTFRSPASSRSPTWSWRSISAGGPGALWRAS